MAMLFAIIHAAIITKPRFSRSSGEDADSFLRVEKEYLRTIIPLVAAVLQANGKSGVREMAFVQGRLRKDFTEATTNGIMNFLREEFSKKKINIKEHTDVIAFEFDNAGKIQLMHFLVAVSTADGILSQGELRKLQEICLRIELKQSTLDAIIAMFRFQFEKDAESKSNHTAHSPDTLLENAYKILEITPQASDTDVKKAYRKMASVHHPDKVAHLGEAMQKKSEEKFRIIASAYELICKRRGIN